MRSRFRKFGADDSGAAVIEFAGVGVVIAIALMNAAEVGRYAYQASEVAAAAQAGAQAALETCDPAHTPALGNCSELTSAVRTAIQSTALGTGVTIDGEMTEAYYCVTTGGELKQVASSSSKPDDCSSVGNSDVKPTLYLQVPVTYAFSPIFPGLTLARSFATTIRKTSWMRMA